MTSIVEAAIETLYEARIPLGPGLTNTEIADVEQQFDIRFSPDHDQTVRKNLSSNERLRRHAAPWRRAASYG